MTKQEAIHKADIIEECISLMKEQQELMTDLLNQTLIAESNLQKAEEKINSLDSKIQGLQKLVREYQKSEEDYQTLLEETEPLLDKLEILMTENKRLKKLIAELK